MTQQKAFKRAVRERMRRTREPYTAARMHALAKQPVPAVAVTNGESVARTLKEGGLADVVIAWRDILHDGPVPALPPARLRKVRAAHLAAAHQLNASEVEAHLAADDAALRRHASHDLTLWFEADLHDQLQLIQVLSRLGRYVKRPRVRMISIGEHPDRARFGGLGELTAAQLETLRPLARPITSEGIELATRAWQAFTASEPSALVALAGVVSGELRYVGDAVSRLLQEYPSASDGLSLTQRRILLAVDRGAGTFAEVLRAHWRTEQHPFLGDRGCMAELHRLAAADSPALSASDGRYALTDFGRNLLAGAVEWVKINGIERWIGGVHLTGRETTLRYDERLETLVTP